MIRFDTGALSAVSIPHTAAEKLLGLSGTCVKIYIFGLLYKEASLEDIMGQLELEKGEVLKGLEELTSAGLIKAAPGGEMTYETPRPKAAPPAYSPVYEDGEFNAMLQVLFSDRELSYEDYQVFYQAMEVYGLPRSVVLMLAEFAITTSRAKNRVSMAAVRQMAAAWAKEGVDTVEKAQQRMEEGGDNLRSAKLILKQMGIHRLPGEEEERLYEKWVKEWGFSFGAVKAAVPATAAIQYPNFKYLDGVLKNLHSLGLHTAAQVRAHFDQREETDQVIKELLRILGAARLVVTDALREDYLKWKDMGFGRGAIRFACAYAVGKGSASMEYVDKLLVSWAARKLFDENSIRAHLQEREVKRRRVAAMLEAAGLHRPVTHADALAYERFTRRYGFGDDVVEYAAQCARGTAGPLKYMEKVLLGWQKAGVTTLEQAQKEHEAFAAPAGQAAKRRPQLMEREGIQQETGDSLEEMFHQMQK
ncbi:MAG: DnaD domain protein [Christensenellaceae bacterium]|nr:DnaD domain protein [Christensenellaceae bacterium]